MSELQNEEPVEAEVIENPATEDTETGSELATDTEEKQEQSEVDVEAEQKAKAQQAFNKQYGEKKQAERDRDAALDKLAALQQKQVAPPPDVGQFPEEFNFDTTQEFEQAKADYFNNVKANAEFTANQNMVQQVQQAQQHHVQQQEATALTEKFSLYNVAAKSFGIVENDLRASEQALLNYGVSKDVLKGLIADPDGSLLITQLANDPVSVDKINRMSVFETVNFINSEIRPKAVELKPRTSSTPNPATTITGGGVDKDAGKYPYIEGATFE